MEKGHDLQEAMVWWQRAGEQGLAEAQFCLATNYFHGASCNVEQSAFWCNRAMQQKQVAAVAAQAETMWDLLVELANGVARFAVSHQDVIRARLPADAEALALFYRGCCLIAGKPDEGNDINDIKPDDMREALVC